jgi:hypothetical protein
MGMGEMGNGTCVPLILSPQCNKMRHYLHTYSERHVLITVKILQSVKDHRQQTQIAMMNQVKSTSLLNAHCYNC